MSVQPLAMGLAAPFSMSFRPALGLIQPPFQFVTGAPFPGVKRQGQMTTHIQHVPRSRKRLHGVVSIGATLPSQKDET
jgi:hypothetical protein